MGESILVQQVAGESDDLYQVATAYISSESVVHNSSNPTTLITVDNLTELFCAAMVVEYYYQSGINRSSFGLYSTQSNGEVGGLYTETYYSSFSQYYPYMKTVHTNSALTVSVYISGIDSNSHVTLGPIRTMVVFK